MKFTKMHGCGNDYIYVNLFDEEVDDPAGLAIRVSNRHFGIGGDGLITIGPSSCADFRMRIYNADGSEAQMCGNGIRCVAKYVYDRGMTDKTEIDIETGDGVKRVAIIDSEAGKARLVRVDMGMPTLDAEKIPVTSDTPTVVDAPIEVCGREWRMTCVSTGNPHAVVFVPSVDVVDLETVGPAFEHHPRFPERVNTEFVEVAGENEIRMRVWERGSGETLACGTGACASVRAAIANGLVRSDVTVHLAGGDLSISYDGESGHIFMTGPAETVFEGEMEVFPI